MSKKDVDKKEIEQEKNTLEKKIKYLDSQLEVTIQSISVNEVNHMTKKTDEKLYKQIKKVLDSEMVKLEETKSQYVSEIDDLDNRKDWIDWISKYGVDIKKRFESVSSELLEG